MARKRKFIEAVADALGIPTHDVADTGAVAPTPVAAKAKPRKAHAFKPAPLEIGNWYRIPPGLLERRLA